MRSDVQPQPTAAAFCNPFQRANPIVGSLNISPAIILQAGVNHPAARYLKHPPTTYLFTDIIHEFLHYLPLKYILG